MTERRFGKFYIDENLLFDQKKENREAVFRPLIIMRAEYLPHKSMYEYIAWCADFDVVEVGQDTPEYWCVIHTKEDGSKTATFERETKQEN